MTGKPRINLRFREDLLTAAKRLADERDSTLTDVFESAVAALVATPHGVTIYALVDPRTNEPRYVGRTTNPANRLRNHVTKARRGGTGNAGLEQWLQELAAAGLRPLIQSLETVDPRDKGEREWHWLEELDNGQLLNVNVPGGRAVGLSLDEGILAALDAEVERRRGGRGASRHAVVEHALEKLLGLRSGNGRSLSPRLRDGVKPRPKGGKR